MQRMIQPPPKAELTCGCDTVVTLLFRSRWFENQTGLDGKLLMFRTRLSQYFVSAIVLMS
jgi:hypothetical protein